MCVTICQATIRVAGCCFVWVLQFGAVPKCQLWWIEDLIAPIHKWWHTAIFARSQSETPKKYFWDSCLEKCPNFQLLLTLPVSSLTRRRVATLGLPLLSVSWLIPCTQMKWRYNVRGEESLQYLLRSVYQKNHHTPEMHSQKLSDMNKQNSSSYIFI